MTLKPSKCRSISIVKGQVPYQGFYVVRIPIPMISEIPGKSLGQWYDVKLKDIEQFEQLKKDTITYMDYINKTLLPGKLKLVCFQFGILPRILWPLTVYEIERVISTQLKQWLGVPRCLSSIGLYGNGKLELPIVDVVEESRCTKARLVMTLSESEDTVVWQREVSGLYQKLFRGQSLLFRDVVGQIEHGRAGLGLIPKVLCGTKQQECRRDSLW